MESYNEYAKGLMDKLGVPSRDALGFLNAAREANQLEKFFQSIVNSLQDDQELDIVSDMIDYELANREAATDEGTQI